MDIVARFEIPYYQILNSMSQVVNTLPDFAKNSDHLIQLYRAMVLSRVFDTKSIALHRTGKIGTYPSTRGQEAVFVGVGDAMLKEDILVPYYRDTAALLQRGVTMPEILLYWSGDERGNCFACGGDDLPFSIPVGSQGLLAAGVATALKIKKEKRAVLTVCGDGATSEGEFYEAMNVAGVWRLPIVFVINNNQWAISLPRSAQTAAQTLAQKAIAAGFSGEQVDGNDVIAVRERVAIALKKAREEQTPTLLEIINYRQSDHTTADDASRYEPQGLRDTEWKNEPLGRLRIYLEAQGLWSASQEEKLQAECTKEVEDAVHAFSRIPLALPETMFDDLYETLPDVYTKQREQVRHDHE